MKFKIAQTMFEKFPDYQVGCLVIKGLSNNINLDQNQIDPSYSYLANSNVKARRDFDTDSNKVLQKFVNWNNAFLDMGIDSSETLPSHKALYVRICEDRKILPNINPLINILNAVSVSKSTPLGGHDIDKTEGDIIVGANSEKLPFIEMNSEKVVEVNENEIVYADSKNVLTRNWVWRQTEKDKITNESVNVFVPIDVFNKCEDENSQIASEIVSALKAFAKYESASFAVVDKNNPELDLLSLPEFNEVHEVDNIEPGVKLNKTIIDQILNKATENILPSKERLEELLISGIRIKLYQGFDPTADTLHIGHSVMMRKLEDFRKLGHKVFMLIGDFTGRIGDPSDKATSRKKLTAEQVKENLKLYTKQAAPILGIDDKENPVEVVYNNDWLGKLNFADIIEIASHFTVQQMIKREMFQKRLEEDRPIYLHEFLYPLMQGYDSVVLDVDIEVGGNDQLFNLLAGRTLMQEMKHKEKFVVAGKLLTTTDGKKMGKSEGNMIKLSDSGVDIYGKIMALPDGYIVPGFELLTSASLAEISQIKDQLENGTNPIELKKQLAYRLTSELKGKEESDAAQKYFQEVFQNKSYTEVEIPEIKVNKNEINILELLVDTLKFSASRGEAKRLIEQGAVKIDDTKISDLNTSVKVQNQVVRAGKKVAKITL